MLVILKALLGGIFSLAGFLLGVYIDRGLAAPLLFVGGLLLGSAAQQAISY